MRHMRQHALLENSVSPFSSLLLHMKAIWMDIMAQQTPSTLFYNLNIRTIKAVIFRNIFS